MSRELQLVRFGASPAEAAELAAYNENVFDLAALTPGLRFPLPDEPFVAFWAAAEAAARERGAIGAIAALAGHLPQLRFPIAAGISATDPYRAATRRGVPPAEIPEATGLVLARPEAVELVLHASPAGRIPLLIARRREEFVALLQALARRNEPEEIPASQGALMVAGYNNWSRIAELRARWEAEDPATRERGTWGEEFQHLQARRELYQDRFILLSDGPYSAVPAADLGLAGEEWRRLSLLIRRDHECTHYLTRRLLGSMRNNLLDELIADYAGLVGATGRFQAAWFLRFVGLEEFPRYRPGGPHDLYRGKPPLSDGAFRVLQALVVRAAENLERFDAGRSRPGGETVLMVAALASLRLEELAGEDAGERLEGALAEVRRRLGG
jgi:hypothetical protein